MDPKKVTTSNQKILAPCYSFGCIHVRLDGGFRILLATRCISYMEIEDLIFLLGAIGDRVPATEIPEGSTADP